MIRRSQVIPNDGSPLTSAEVDALASIEVGLRREDPELARELSGASRLIALLQALRRSRSIAWALVLSGFAMVFVGLSTHLTPLAVLGFVVTSLGLHSMSFRWSWSSVRNLCRRLGLEPVGR